MKKPQLCLALSVSLALLQATLLQANAAPVWQELANGAKSQKATTGKPVARQTAQRVVRTAPVAKATPVASYSAHGVASSGMNGQVILFLGKGKELGAQGTSAPAAALTIHTSLPEETVVASESAEKPTLVAMGGPGISSDITPSIEEKPVTESLSSELSNAATSKNLLAQLAPDQIVAQAETNATPIPPVVSGTIDLEEFKPSNAIDLKVSQSRTFRLRNKIIRTSISDPSIAEPVVVAENQMVLLGKAPGGATLVVWDDAGNSVAIDVRVNHDYSNLQAMLREIDPRIIVKPFSVGGSDRVILSGDVDHPESVIRAFATANAFMDDRGMNITVANGRIMGTRLGEQGGQMAGGGAAGNLSAIGTVDRYAFFGNQNNNISRAQTIISDGGRVTSLIKVRKVPLIVLHVTFLEMNSSAAREIGAQLGFSFTSQSFGFSVGGNNNLAGNGFLTSAPGVNGTINNPFGGNALAPSTGGAVPFITVPTTINPATGAATNFAGPFFPTPNNFGATTAPVNFVSPNGLLGLGLGSLITPPGLLQTANLFGIPGGAAFSPQGLGNLFTAVSNIASGNSARFSVNPTVQAIIAHSRARVLAEPTLVTISGERAAFLAGGEIPILQSIATAGTAAQSVVYEPFGLRLNMIPVLMENGAINLQVAPEERLIAPGNGFNVPFSSTVIPAFTTRKTQTTVELRPGQELFICGLVSANHGRELTKTPVIGEIPVLGALYRSKAFAKNESELVVAVRPEIILPGTPGQLKLPEEISKVEGPRDTNIFQVEPTVLDERYVRSGRAEKSLQLPGVLPPDAPVPDNK